MQIMIFFLTISIPDPHVFLEWNSEYWARMFFVKRTVLEYDQTCFIFTESTDRVMIDVKREYGTEN